MSAVLDVQGLRKAFGSRHAVDGISLAVPAGSVLALLGPNGAGKSTTVGMICGLTEPDAGRAAVAGIALASDPMGYKRRIGLVPQDLALFEDLTARHNLELFGALYDIPRERLRQRSAEVLAAVGLADRAGDKPATFSGGMKRRLNIACALIHDPDVILLDEPTAGVDPQSRNAIFDTLEALKAAGKALVYTTHYMEEAERLADAVVIIDHGRVVAQGTLAELYGLLPAAHSLLIDIDGSADRARAAMPALQALPGVREVRQEGARLSVGLDELSRCAAGVLQALQDARVPLRHVSSGQANLEDVFLAVTGRQLRD
jgi:ABC-2 type transport system ATP-binding protein